LWRRRLWLWRLWLWRHLESHGRTTVERPQSMLGRSRLWALRELRPVGAHAGPRVPASRRAEAPVRSRTITRDPATREHGTLARSTGCQSARPLTRSEVVD